ncbi:hypothetical protein BV22DRAFT_1063654 [Leucogyrophana mollusca]|uniref:Uncharacterized protein n=1 Tax=Leucogyrophana mollusca TaxID=85980 RepID=A0ACB8BMH9_9AGAM|nr:hypothetical protein BV22DRAFT_1063654 [Leucogyrophana mollusca]
MASTTSDPPTPTTYGVTYPPELLSSLPLLPSSPHAPIRLLPVKTFSTLHLAHLTSHPPDSVLFPFMHGLEGTNEPQNLFFASPQSQPPGGMIQDHTGRAVRPPRYRGLVWVLCDDDVPDSAVPSSDSDDDDDDESDDEESEGMAVDTDAMDVDEPVRHEAHMHPVTQRGLKISTTISSNSNTSAHPGHAHDRRPSNASTASSASIASTAASTSSSSDSTTATSYIPSPTSPTHQTFSCPPSPVAPPPDHQPQEPPPSTTPPVLTSSFLPSTLLRNAPSPEDFVCACTLNDWVWIGNHQGAAWGDKICVCQRCGHRAGDKDGYCGHRHGGIRDRYDTSPSSSNSEPQFEFRPPKVPDGISLRNFGIQVPIYATISDIVVYSPRGASPAAVKLAERFAGAVRRVREERRARWEEFVKAGKVSRGAPGETSGAPGGASSDTSAGMLSEGSCGANESDSEDDLLQYNVFVLDADARTIEQELPHLVVRKEDAVRGAHTEGSDGRIVGDPGVNGEAQTPAIASSSTPMPTTTSTAMTPAPTHFLLHRANTIDFAQREKEEMRDLTRASEIISVFPSDWSATAGTDADRDARVGQVFLGNVNDVPVVPYPRSKTKAKPPRKSALQPQRHKSQECGDVVEEPEGGEGSEDPFAHAQTNPGGYDICIECHEGAPIPTASHLRAVEEHVRALDGMWAERCRELELIEMESGLSDGLAANGSCGDLPANSQSCKGKSKSKPRPPPHANAVIHLPFPSSPTTTPSTLNSLMVFIKFLERMVSDGGNGAGSVGMAGGRARSVTSASPSPSPASTFRSNRDALSKTNETTTNGTANGTSTTPFNTTPSITPTPTPLPTRTVPSMSNPNTSSRPLKILLHSTDGYTESSVAALCLLMAVRGISLPEAYLELQVVKRRSFFVYQNEVGVLKKVETRLGLGRKGNHDYGSGYDRAVAGTPPMLVPSQNGVTHQQNGAVDPQRSVVSHNGVAHSYSPTHSSTYPPTSPPASPSPLRPLALSSSFPSTSVSTALSNCPAVPLPCSASALPPSTSTATITLNPMPALRNRPRASTMPTFIADHQTWFNDARFDGSFPSRVLPFLYLGNLNHATNAYMLHALGITHVVSVGECALVPPPQSSTASPCPLGTVSCSTRPSPAAHFVAGKGPGGQGSLWIEEREGRIKVLDIKGVCDDGIDTLEPQLSPICSWIEKARLEGGQVLVHCRVGVSRSATVTIAYVMQHLGLSLVDAYLVVRSRRLSVLIQPNMRLLYNLLGWEVKLARERCGGDEERLKGELGKALNWPYLAKEVHALNEKYLT